MNKYGRPPKNRQITADKNNSNKKTFNCPDCTVKEDGLHNPCDSCIRNVNNYDKS